MAPAFLVLWQCPACRHLWRDSRSVLCDSACPECGLRDVDALTWCTNEDENRLLTPEEMERDVDRQVAALLSMGA
jgi:predicted  nucleic acid-binding Zn-ribbon protein